MPTIEIISLNSTQIGFNQEDFEVAIIEETTLISHRALFYKFLKKQSGVIIHLGNPDFKNDKEGGFWGGALLDWTLGPDSITIPRIDTKISTEEQDWGADQSEKFRFEEKYVVEIDRLLNTALAHSPDKIIYFLTDYQLGPAKPEFATNSSIAEFWEIHNTAGLTFNTLYKIAG